MGAGIAGNRRGLGESEVLALIQNLLSDVNPLDLGTADAGVAIVAARDDHVHAHGTIASGDLHTEYQKESEKSANNGYAGLDAGGRTLAADAAPSSVYSTGGAQAMRPVDIGLAVIYSLAGGAPAFTTLVTADAASDLGRWVFGTFAVANTAVNAAEVAVEIETGIATGVYTKAQRAFRPIAAELRSAETPYCFFVPAGRRYRFIQLGLAGTTETVVHYSFADA